MPTVSSDDKMISHWPSFLGSTAPRWGQPFLELVSDGVKKGDGNHDENLLI